MDAGERAVLFINNLRHGKGEWAGQPFNLRPWQEEIVRDLFGTLREDGLRQYRTAWLELPRKNGKTHLAAAIALQLLVGDHEPGAEVILAAVDRDQASLAYDVAVSMVRQSPYLSGRLKVIPSTRRIVDPETGSYLRAIAADAAGSHGFNCHGIVADEVHAWPNRELWDVLTTSTGSRRQPLAVAITTAGYDRTSLAWELHDYACKVRDGIIDDPSFYPCIYGAPEDADWTDEEVWHQANPGLEDFRGIEEMRTLCERAKATPALQNTFRRLYLNQWTASESRWLDLTAWDACGGPVNREMLRGMDCYAGLDLSSTTDLTAFVLAFPIDDKVLVLPHFWAPRMTAQRAEERDRVPYTAWARESLITLTEGNAVDYGQVEHDIKELAKEFRIKELAYDRWNASYLIQRLQDDGASVVPVGMGYATMSAPMKHLEELVLTERLVHGGNPLLNWQADNLMVEQDAAGNLKPSKAKSRQRIDGMVALVMALSRLMVRSNKVSRYEERGVMVI